VGGVIDGELLRATMTTVQNQILGQNRTVSTCVGRVIPTTHTTPGTSGRVPDTNHVRVLLDGT
jgi:hypothetical protein